MQCVANANMSCSHTFNVQGLILCSGLCMTAWLHLYCLAALYTCTNRGVTTVYVAMKMTS